MSAASLGMTWILKGALPINRRTWPPRRQSRLAMIAHRDKFGCGNSAPLKENLPKAVKKFALGSRSGGERTDQPNRFPAKTPCDRSRGHFDASRQNLRWHRPGRVAERSTKP